MEQFPKPAPERAPEDEYVDGASGPFEARAGMHIEGEEHPIPEVEPEMSGETKTGVDPDVEKATENWMEEHGHVWGDGTGPSAPATGEEAAPAQGEQIA